MKLKIKAARFVSLFTAGIFVALTGHAQTFLTNGLVAYYPFNGNANDMSGNACNGTMRWTPKIGPPVKMDFLRSAWEKRAGYESKTKAA